MIATTPPPSARPATERDSVFERWASEGLVWLPQRGMGWYPVTEAPYDAAYFAKYQGYADTEMGRRITAARVALVNRYAGPDASVCDIGIGCGDFITARPFTRGTDVNPAGIRWLRERGLEADLTSERYDALTFWDSLEHIPNPGPLLAHARGWVFCCLPIFTGPEHVLSSKHFRPDEHCWYWTARGLMRWMAEHGWTCVEIVDIETTLGREDIHTFAFRRIA
jgi:hypothetical protein